jgi:hypothetical protein
MFGNDGNENEKPQVGEVYAAACGSSNLQVGNDSTIRTPGDIVAAAGMNKHRTGLALMRLRTEWDRSAKPKPMTPAQIEALAQSLKTGSAGDNPYFGPVPQPARPNPHAGLVREQINGKERFRLPMVVAHEQAAAWHEHEQRLLLQNLKTMPLIRDALTHWLVAEEGRHVVAQVLLWWLDPKCAVCGGSGLRVVAGTGGRSAGKPCGECKGKSLVAGERRIPHGGVGRRLVSYINECVGHAQRELREGTSLWKRTPSGDAHRLGAKSGPD